MAAQKPWADGPFELISTARLPYKKGEKVRPVHGLASEMIAVHNSILRGINSIYLQCINVESAAPAQVPAFLNFVSWWGQFVHEHHSAEESTIFPALGKATGEPDIMAANIAQHRQFHLGLDALNDYVGTVQAGKEKYDGAKLKAIVDSFMPVLRQHLDEEIVTLVGLERFEDKVDWTKLQKEVTKKIIEKTKDPSIQTTALPLVIVCHEMAFEDRYFSWFPPLPWIAWVLYKWVWFGKHKDVWKFAPCDKNGVRQELPFV